MFITYKKVMPLHLSVYYSVSACMSSECVVLTNTVSIRRYRVTNWTRSVTRVTSFRVLTTFLLITVVIAFHTLVDICNQ